MRTTLQEGNLEFQFHAGVVASQYDRWAFYRKRFQQKCFRDNKAVDLVCVHGECAWLIEVKDYRVQQRTKAIDLADEVAIKVRDSLAGIWAAGLCADTTERAVARQMVKAQCLRVVCHLEQPAKASRLRPRAIEPDKLRAKLRTLLKAVDAHPIVMDHTSTSRPVPWVVYSTS